MRLTDPITNWSFECLTDREDSSRPPAGGLVLQEITHDGHNFAKDIRVIGLWIETELVDPPNTVVRTEQTFYVLGRDAFTVSEIVTRTPRPIFHPTVRRTFDYLSGADAALNFTEYFKEPSGNYVGYGVTAEFDAPHLFTSHLNCNYSGLKVRQIVLFSRYGNSPPHEPSGTVHAARLHPMVHYEFSTNESFDNSRRFTRVSSIRFDYRLHLFLDRHYNVARNALLTQLGNQGGLFADSDSAVGTGVAGIGAFLITTYERNPVATAVSRGVFDAVEKPLVLEVVAPGLVKGFSRFTQSRHPHTANLESAVRCWDNLHWWGGRGPGAPLISAPGAFHCAHLHWRWGSFGAPTEVISGRDPRFHPHTWPAGMQVPPEIRGMWGPLVDPGIWMQTIRVAVTKNDPRLNPNRGRPLRELSAAFWDMLFGFHAGRPFPEDISMGADIVLWYSAEVHRNVTVMGETYESARAGTVFIHGFFFAHDAERRVPTVGSTDPDYRPRSEAMIRTPPLSWFRPASG